jgi:ADP-heptose:LPS heptosyltransferase
MSGSARGPLGRRLKALRMAAKEPLMKAMSRLAAMPLDRRPRLVEELHGHPPGRILVIRSDRIGDLLAGTPLIAALRRRWPAASLTLVGGPKNRAPAELLPYLARGPEFRRDPVSWSRLASWLPRQRFDLAVSLRAEVLSGALIAAASGARVRMVVNANARTAAAFNLVLGVEDHHHLRRYWTAARRLGIAFPEPPRPIVEVPEAAERRAAEVVASLGAAPGAGLVGLGVPNRSDRRHRGRAWTTEQLAELARALLAGGARVVLFGAGSELAEAADIREAVPGVDVIPPLSLAQVAGVQRRLSVFVSGLTGTLHLADAVGTATVTLGLPKFVRDWRPLGPAHRALTSDSVPDIPVAAVLEAVRAVLAARR